MMINNIQQTTIMQRLKREKLKAPFSISYPPNTRSLHAKHLPNIRAIHTQYPAQFPGQYTPNTLPNTLPNDGLS